MAMTAAQLVQCAKDFCQDVFVGPNATATFNTDQIQSAISAIDAGMNTTLANAAAAKGGATTIVAALQSQITSAMPGASVQQQALLLIYWARRAAGL